MNTVPFDTLKMAERLEDVGVPAAQAKVHTDVLAEAISAEDASIVERFCGKSNIALELASLNTRFAAMSAEFVSIRAETKAEFASIRAESKAEFASIRAAIERMDARLNGRIDKQDAKFDKQDAKFDKQDAKIDKLDAKIDQRAAELKIQLMVWVGSVGVLQMALITGLALKLAP